MLLAQCVLRDPFRRRVRGHIDPDKLSLLSLVTDCGDLQFSKATRQFVRLRPNSAVPNELSERDYIGAPGSRRSVGSEL
jgi:hypothetical protein